MYRFIFLFLLITLTTQIFSQKNSDTLKVKIDEVLVLSKSPNFDILISQPFDKSDSNTFTQFSPFSISESLTKIPGISVSSMGPGISKPVVRGLSGSRVATILNDLPLESLSWDDEHSLGINNADFEQAVLIKGASTLLYGPEAIGGVIVFSENELKRPAISVMHQQDFMVTV